MHLKLHPTAADPLHRKEPVEVVWESSKDAPWAPPQGGVPGTSSWEKASGKTQDEAERFDPFERDCASPVKLTRAGGSSRRR